MVHWICVFHIIS